MPSNGNHAESETRRGSIAVFAPSPVLGIIVEVGPDQPEIHLHAGGQGFWVAHMAALLGSEVTLCCALGGESGGVLRPIIEGESVSVHSVDSHTASGVYIHDRRSGSRVEFAAADSRPLDRHAADALYGIALTAGLDADVTILTGPQPTELLDADVYRRLAADLQANGRTVIADLCGPALTAALSGGLDMLKISHEELIADGYAHNDAVDELVDGARQVVEAGAEYVLVSRAAESAIVLTGDERSSDVIELRGPRFEPLDPWGSGDSMSAALAVGLASGMAPIEALRLAVAAGALNATRRGLGTGTRDEIENLRHHVTVEGQSNFLSRLVRRLGTG
jgi:1-phosphofructokinase